MSFINLIIKNPFRNKTKMILSVIGIAIAIATIVALGMVTEGMKESVTDQLKAGGADFVVMKNSSAENEFTVFKETYADEISKINGVNETADLLSTTRQLGDYFLNINGIKQDRLSLAGVKITQGRAYADDKNEIILGKLTAQKLKKKVGDTISLSGNKYAITGIYETGNIELDSASFLSLKNVQGMDDKEGKAMMIFVKINKSAKVGDITKAIENNYHGELTTISSMEDLQNTNEGLKTMGMYTAVISLLAIIIGGIGIINTMMMSVFERTREIGVLKAVGWKSRRVLEMILGESVVLTLIAGLVGTIIGIVGIKAIVSISGEPMLLIITPSLLLNAIGVAIIVGLIGGIYPAYRASRLSPTEALRYE